MGSDAITETAAALGLTATQTLTMGGSFSGSQVVPARTAAGEDVILKITSDPHSAAWAGSLRELDFYRDRAASIGVRTPRLLDHCVTEDQIALVITSHPAPTPAVAWTHADWLQLACDLAAIHHHRSTGSGGQSATVVHDTADDTVADYWSGSGGRVQELLHDPAPLVLDATVLDSCFVHGDCHTENLSHDHGGLVWLDWQGCGPGNPAGDLAFPSVRATPSGAQVPQQEMITVYAARRDLDPERVLRAVRAQELLVMLFQWPHYAGMNSSVADANLRARVSALTTGFLD